MKLGKHVDLEMAVQSILGELERVDANASIKDELGARLTAKMA